MDAQQAARAFYERGALAAFVTGLFLDDKHFVRRLCAAGLPASLNKRVAKELRRRAITEVPPDLIISYPWLETLRTVLARFARSPVSADIVWDLLSRNFDRTVAHQHLAGIQAVYAFESTAKETFERSKETGVARILSMPSPDSKEFEEIKSRELARFPELRSKYDGYFSRRFAERYERRSAEIALADVIIANSEPTRQSHIRAGADAERLVSVPLAAPPAIDAVTSKHHPNNALEVIWAGNFTLGKGAHYFIDAWRALRAGSRARVSVYGAISLPERVLRPLPQGLKLMGSVPQEDLFAAFERADVLVFPTLADGFGMVVPEAFSRGLPVITTDKAGASDMVEHRRNGFIIPAASSKAITETLQWCLDNRDALYDMRFASLQTARRWQWPDYRRTLIAKITEGLRRRGYDPHFGSELPASQSPS